MQRDSLIKTLTDLKGKRVAFARGSSAHNVMVKALALAGLTLKDIVPTYLAPADDPLRLSLLRPYSRLGSRPAAGDTRPRRPPS